jgi:hypothetical protein
MAAVNFNIYQGQADSNVTNISPGITTIYTHNFGGLLYNTKIATIEAHAVVFDLQNFATSSGWIHYTAPLNTGIAYGGTFSNPPPYILRPNLPGTDTPPSDDGVLSVNVGGAGPNFAYIQRLYFDPLISTLYLKAENSISGAPQPISWKINWKITCF